jgi:hypothetical protein
MTATTIKQTEATPEAYPDPPEGLSTEAAALDPAIVWQRLEGYIAWRFSERAVTWIAEGPGEWVPPLHVTVIDTTERWTGTAWEVVTDLQLSPLGGYCLPACGPYRFTATVGGGGDAPASVLEAYRRLAEYMAGIDFHDIGLRTENLPDIASFEFAPPSWRAQALVNSGAADLLRNYRRA